ncbi:MAG: diguanylate cyclase [Proteobacteria bacterium]|nr:diguanylate cyclase [Pseudomonadota bacterium]MBU1593946.1 diguanylate cyclase [Pseudomonadota bacterium]
MRSPADILAATIVDRTVSLTRQDLIDFEHALQHGVQAFLPFASYSLFFPRQGDPCPALRYDHKARELALPLVLRGETLGVFVARGVRLAAPRALPPVLQLLATAVLEKLLLYKRSVTDALTGLANREHFLQSLTQEIDLIQHSLEATTGGRSDPELQGFSASLGVILLDLDSFQWINERYGYQVGDSINAQVGQAIAGACPRHVTAARIHNDTFALLAPDASPKTCFELAELVRQAISRLSFQDEVTGDNIGVTASLGYANYPQSLRGRQFQRTPREQARILMRAAGKAVGASKDHGRNRVFGFGEILKTGGRILDVLPMQRLAVSLGRSVGAQEGLRYLVWSPRFQQRTLEARLSGDERLLGRSPTLYKSEIVLSEVQEDMSFAEVLHAGDPAWVPEPGDQLTLIQERDSLFASQDNAQDNAQPRRDMLTGLYGYRDFLAFFARARPRSERFCVVLTRIQDSRADQPLASLPADAPGGRTGGLQQRLDAAVAQVAALAERVLLQDAGCSPARPGEKPARAAGGRFGLGGLVHFLPGADPAEVEARVLELCRLAAEEHGLDLAVGLAGHPFLHLPKADALDNARKGLDHAQLLPAPRVAVFGSLSLNVSADRLFVEGDLYAAVEEFKLALLADPANMLARNSLGICYAQMGKADLARREFELVVAAEEDNVMAHYNLGWACQRLGETASARTAYERCLSLDPGHGFSLVRLGSLAEAAGDLSSAEDLYQKALDTPGTEAAALRPLARVALAQGDRARARECLHLALSADHNDAQALHMLARLYLDSGEDPQIAEVLARQAAALRPERQEFWDTLVLALNLQGRHDDARRAEARGRP